MTRINEFGQPIGDPVPGWTPRPATEPAELVGTRVRLEALRPDHASVLHGPMALESSPRISITDAEWPAIRAALEAWLAPDNFSADGSQRAKLRKFRAD